MYWGQDRLIIQHLGPCWDFLSKTQAGILQSVHSLCPNLYSILLQGGPHRYVLSFVFFKLLSSGTSGIGQPQYSSFTVLGIVGPGGRDVLPACPAAPLYALWLLDQGDPLEFTLLRILISVRAICSA